MAVVRPTFAGFVSWVRTQMQINTTVLPDDSIYLEYAYEVAVALVNFDLACCPGPIYLLAVYNLGGSNLINFAQDLPDAPIIPGSDPAAPYFAALRQKWNILSFLAGVVQASNDESTGQTLLVPKPAADFTLADLQYLKDPYGRVYLQFAQKYGPTIWGST